MRNIVKKTTAVIMLCAGLASAYLESIKAFVDGLQDQFTEMGNGIAIVMFLYGAAKFIYSADDPGGRKQGKDVCIAALIAMIIINIAPTVIGSI